MLSIFQIHLFPYNEISLLFLACLKDLLTNGFYNYENEFYCSRDYQKLFGVKCTACGQFIEGGVVTIFDDSFHEACFICVQCRYLIAFFNTYNQDVALKIINNCLYI